MECLGLAPTGTEEPGRVLERWFREIRLGLPGFLGLGLQAGVTSLPPVLPGRPWSSSGRQGQTSGAPC